MKFKRLPDINRPQEMDRHGFSSYGRFAVLRDDSLWVGEIASSHPRETLAGFYWAIGSDGELLISTRGNILDYDFLEDSSILDQLTHELIRRGHVW